jgi:hypothetical protein
MLSKISFISFKTFSNTGTKRNEINVSVFVRFQILTAARYRIRKVSLKYTDVSEVRILSSGHSSP